MDVDAVFVGTYIMQIYTEDYFTSRKENDYGELEKSKTANYQ